MLTAVVMCTHFLSYLRGAQLTLRMDHSSLRWLQKFRNSDGMLACWHMLLGQFSVTFEYRLGAQHANADSMSRQCGQCMRPGCLVSSPDSRTELLDQPYASSEMGDSMDADLLPELSGETWVAATYLDELMADLPSTDSDLDFIVASQRDETLTTVCHRVQMGAPPPPPPPPRVAGVFGVISRVTMLAAAVRESVGRHGREVVASLDSSGDVLTAGSACSGTSGSDSSIS